MPQSTNHLLEIGFVVVRSAVHDIGQQIIQENAKGARVRSFEPAPEAALQASIKNTRDMEHNMRPKEFVNFQICSMLVKTRRRIVGGFGVAKQSPRECIHMQLKGVFSAVLASQAENMFQ